MRTITQEEHYAPPAFMEGPGRELKEQAAAARDHPQVAAGYGYRSTWRSSRPLEGVDRHSGRP